MNILEELWYGNIYPNEQSILGLLSIVSAVVLVYYGAKYGANGFEGN